MEHTKYGYAKIHLADNEHGNTLMLEIASKYFQSRPECNFVQVWEHGGWWVGFRRDLSIYNSALHEQTSDEPEGKQPRKCERYIRRGMRVDFWTKGGVCLHG